MRRTIVLGITLGSLLAATTAQAGGLNAAIFGADHGAVTADNPTAIYYNPAGLAASRGLNIFLDGTFYYRLASFSHGQLCPPAAEPTQCAATPSNNEYGEPDSALGANYGTGSLTNFGALPMMGATLRLPLGKDFGLALGAGFFAPFGGASSWSKNDDFDGHPRYPGAVDGVQRWSTIDGTMRVLFISGAAALSIHDMVYVGVSGGAAITQVDALKAKNVDGSNNLNAEGRARVFGEGLHGQLGAGIMVKPLDSLRIGFSYQAPVGIDGVVLPSTVQIHDGGGQVSESETEFHTVWPDVFRLGVAYKVTEDLELRLSGNLQRWNLLQDQCVTKPDSVCEMNEDGMAEGDTEIVLNIPRHWNETVGVKLGASIWPSDTVEVFASVGYDSNAIPDETFEPGALDFHDIATTIGGRFQIIDQLAAAVSYTQWFNIPRNTTGASKLGEFHSNSRGPDMGGAYALTVGTLNVNVQVSLDPFGSAEPAAQPAAEPLAEEPPAVDPG